MIRGTVPMIQEEICQCSYTNAGLCVTTSGYKYLLLIDILSNTPLIKVILMSRVETIRHCHDTMPISIEVSRHNYDAIHIIYAIFKKYISIFLTATLIYYMATISILIILFLSRWLYGDISQYAVYRFTPKSCHCPNRCCGKYEACGNMYAITISGEQS